MIDAVLGRLERRREIENRSSVLDRDDAPRRKTAAVTRALDLVDDRDPGIAGAHEIGVQGMHGPVLEGTDRRDQRLADIEGAFGPVLAPLARLVEEQAELDALDLKVAAVNDAIHPEHKWFGPLAPLKADVDKIQAEIAAGCLSCPVLLIFASRLFAGRPVAESRPIPAADVRRAV